MSGTCEIKEAEDFSRNPSETRTTPEDLRERYEEQQRRLACPACGEEPFVG